MKTKIDTHLMKLAEKLAKQDAIGKVYSTDKKGFYDMLLNLKNALRNGNYWTRVDTVSKSGMSRCIVIAYTKDNGVFRVWNEHILKLAGCDKNGRIGGCGMDMLFAAQYNLWSRLFPKKRHQEMPRYNTLP